MPLTSLANLKRDCAGLGRRVTVSRRKPWLLLCLLLVTSIGGTEAMAQEENPNQKQIDALNAQAALDKAESDAKKARIELLNTEKALGALEGTGSELADLQKRKGLAEAQKDAAKAEADALTQRIVGDAKAGPFSGLVDTAKEALGGTEAALLAAAALNAAADQVARDVGPSGTSFVVFTAQTMPRFAKLLQFRFRVDLLKRGFEGAGVTAEAVDRKEALPALALITAGIEAVKGLLGFFKTDFTIGRTEVSIQDTALALATAGALTRAGASVAMPSVFKPTTSDAAVTSLSSELSELARRRAVAEESTRVFTEQVGILEKTGAANDAETARTLKVKLVQLQGVTELYDEFVKSLQTPDSNGSTPLEALLDESGIAASLSREGTVALLVRLESVGGSFFIKKNIWTGLGGMPLYMMGGITISYGAFDAKTGILKRAGVIPLHGGFVPASKIKKWLEASSTQRDSRK